MNSREIDEIVSEMDRQIKAMTKSWCENTRKLIAYVRRLEKVAGIAKPMAEYHKPQCTSFGGEYRCVCSTGDFNAYNDHLEPPHTEPECGFYRDIIRALKACEVENEKVE